MKMKILTVANSNKGYFAPFISDQTDALQRAGVDVAFFGIKGKGMWGYLKNRKALIYKIKTEKPDLIHAHYGLSGLLANLQCKTPVITTYHGSDINFQKAFRFSKISIALSKFNIFVSQKNLVKSNQSKRYALIPCGVDLNLFALQEKQQARKKLGLDLQKKYVLFAGSFDNAVKNADLAKKSVEKIENVTLLELKGYTREQVASLMCAVDCALLTSFSEGSPQFAKEAMACNCPLVSVDVGDVRENLQNVENSFVSSSYDADEIATLLQKVLATGNRSNGRVRIAELGLDNQLIAQKLIAIYKNVLKK